MLLPINDTDTNRLGTIISTIDPDDVPGYIEFNGATVSKDLYSVLYEVLLKLGLIPETKSIDFELPDWSGRFLRQHGDQAEILGNLQEDAIRNIIGRFGECQDARDITGPFTAKYRRTWGGGGGDYNKYWIDFDASIAVPTADENRPSNVSVRYLVKY